MLLKRQVICNLLLLSNVSKQFDFFQIMITCTCIYDNKYEAEENSNKTSL